MSYQLRLRIFQIIIFLSVFLNSYATQNKTAEDTPYLKRVIINSDSILIENNSLSSGTEMIRNINLSYRCNNLRIEAGPPDSITYRFFLAGYDKKWSDWQKANFKEYTNLPAGKYSFKVRYVSSDNSAGEITLFSFRVLPLWYFSKLAVALYLIVFALISWTLYNVLNLRFARALYTLEQIINKRTEDLVIEKEKTEALLDNVLPKNTASEIIETGKATKTKYNFATVLFSDIQGFTKIAEETNPEILIDELDKFFFHFDSVVEKYSIEKIKTIGDAYMCAGGIPEKNRTNPVEVILAALEMMSYMNKLKESSELEGMRHWDIRIGIHTGTVVAGVVGHKKLTYDIWGDTVNTASRMESSGEAGKINISGTTYEFVKDFFSCEYRGKMPVKYKGELEMYFVTGISPGLCNEDGSPNNKFTVKMQLIRLQDVEEAVIKMFDDEAAPNLYFHNSSMVRSISNHVELLSRGENISDEEFINLKLASIFLFTGYITDYENPLDASISKVEEMLPVFRFGQNIIESVKMLITNNYTDTIVTINDNILHDSRYDYLGRVDYLKLTDKLYRERAEYGKHADKKIWEELLEKQLYDHQFITNSARAMRNISYEDQLTALKSYFNNLNS